MTHGVAIFGSWMALKAKVTGDVLAYDLFAALADKSGATLLVFASLVIACRRQHAGNARGASG